MSEGTRRGEFEWIDRVAEILDRAGAAGRPGIGDDAAVVAGPDGPAWAWTVDTLVEGVHFRFDWLAPRAVGHRALVASLSDLAATGARPVGALVTAAGPPATIDSALEGIYEGIAALAERSGCPILGGDLSRAEGPLHVTVTALGRVVGGPPLGRDGARPGDEVWATGRFGGPAAALALLEAATASAEAAPLEALGDHPAYARLAAPEPRVEEVLWLRERTALHAAIDVSDGISGDARHLARRSGVSLVIEPARLPLHPGAVRAGADLGAGPLEWALHGGEEFELLLCAGPGALDPLAAGFAARFELPLTRIGTVEAGEGVHVRRGGAVEPLPPAAWDHFGGAGLASPERAP